MANCYKCNEALPKDRNGYYRCFGFECDCSMCRICLFKKMQADWQNDSTCPRCNTNMHFKLVDECGICLDIFEIGEMATCRICENRMCLECRGNLLESTQPRIFKSFVWPYLVVPEQKCPFCRNLLLFSYPWRN